MLQTGSVLFLQIWCHFWIFDVCGRLISVCTLYPTVVLFFISQPIIFTCWFQVLSCFTYCADKLMLTKQGILEADCFCLSFLVLPSRGQINLKAAPSESTSGFCITPGFGGAQNSYSMIKLRERKESQGICALFSRHGFCCNIVADWWRLFTFFYSRIH